ncbi:hypothetical protein DOY81_004800 [Sarcophaga bullata]|nr:hypothetical protein DOY81_004800 [Sarcophaga bullata]
MAFKFNFLMFITVCLMAQTLAAAVKKVSPKEQQVAAVYIKDSNTGELRFLGGGFKTNKNLDAWITQKQDFLEQLRPAVTGTGPTVIVPTNPGTDTNTNTNTPTLTNTDTNSPTTGGINTDTPTTDTAGAAVPGGNRRRVNNRRRVK